MKPKVEHPKVPYTPFLTFPEYLVATDVKLQVKVFKKELERIKDDPTHELNTLVL
ncbi:hypothetical protein PPEV_gp131 [Pseudomonas phage EL]|uniref:Uncharacterized protein n=1 Tax=Pseudomonas phage EL TaxID=273133 RepID=Q2Z0V0_9CAUD|nr:hypothetical protein PPEV_gp131 [Pseudomonas phage EL]UZV40061.1 hypothetical protein [Pseudomonas phage IR-QUMS-PaBa1-GHS-2021]CAG27225.1 hypothetical protein [Pseudomonas phage EL]